MRYALALARQPRTNIRATPFYTCPDKKNGAALRRHQVMAEWTGLEPATPGVTGRYSNQLNYHSAEVLVGAEGIEPPTFAV